MNIRSRPVVRMDDFGTLKELRDKCESDTIEARLAYYKYAYQAVADSLDVSRVQLVALRKKHGLNQ